MRDTDRSAIVHGNRKSRLDANYAAFKTRNEAQTESDHVEEARPRPHLAYIWQTHVAKILKHTPEVAVFERKVPYISEIYPDEKQNLPYITQIDGRNGDGA